MLGADGVEDREDLVLLDELAGRVDRPRRVVAVVAPEVADLAPEDAAVGVDVLEVGVRARADGAEGRGRAAERDGAADQDLGRGHARVSLDAPAASAPARREQARAASDASPRDRLAQDRQGQLGGAERDRARSSASAGSGRAGCPGSARPSSRRASASGARRAGSASPCRAGGSSASRVPFRPAVLTPPSLTTVSEPLRGSAVSTATRRDQPPVRRAVSCTVARAEGLGVAGEAAARALRAACAGEVVVAGQVDRQPPGRRAASRSCAASRARGSARG